MFIWRIIIFLPKKLGKAIINPSSRGKIRWAFFAIILLTLYGVVTDYPQGYNKLAVSLNTQMEKVPYLRDFQFDNIQEREFNLGLDLQGGAHLVYQADLSELEDGDELEAMARLRDRIERRINALGVSEPLVQVAGGSRLVVELAGVDTETAIDRIGETPLLEFREQNEEPDRDLTEEEKEQLKDFNFNQLIKAEDAFGRVTSGQESFEDVAKEVSEDVSTKNSGGDLGGITRVTNPGLYEAVEDTLIGKVVNQVIEGDDGYYIVRVDDKKETDVEMELSHILICYQGSANCGSELSRDEASQKIAEIKQEISIDNFADKSKEFSTDPSAAENFGSLGWVSPATVVEDFENAAKELAVGEISDPVETEFGFHLIYKKNERPFGEIFLHAIFFQIQDASDYLPEPDPWKNTGLTGSNVTDAQLVFQSQTNAPQVSIQFDEEGTKLFSELTKKYIGSPIAIYLDGRPISIPTVQQQISNGEAVITGSFSIAEARDLARRLKDGALPVQVNLVQQQTVGATLGAESLQKSLKAGLIGLIFVAIFMLLYYRLSGLIAIFALMVYGVLTLMVFKLIGVTLTLSGLAGFVLSLGMAVDANVLIFERFKEERKDNKDLAEAVQAGFTRAWPSIRDGNISTLITCFILAWFGTSLVKGFAITLGLGVMISMFSAVVVTKTFMRLVIAWPVKKWSFLFGSGWNIKG